MSERKMIWADVKESVSYRVYLSGEIGEMDADHTEVVDLLRSLEEGISVDLFINSPGGYCSTADMYVSAIQETKGFVTTHAIGSVCSAACNVFLAGHARAVHKGADFMFHNVQTGGMGDVALLKLRMNHMAKLQRLNSYEIYAEILTEEELKELFDRAGEVWLTDDEMIERLQKATLEKKETVAEVDIPSDFKIINGLLHIDGKPPMVGGICNHDTFGNSPEAQALRDLVNAPTESAMRLAVEESVTLPFPKTKVADAKDFPSEDTTFEIALDDGYTKTFDIETLCEKDFDEYNMDEIKEIGDAFQLSLSGLSRGAALATLIDELTYSEEE